MIWASENFVRSSGLTTSCRSLFLALNQLIIIIVTLWYFAEFQIFRQMYNDSSFCSSCEQVRIGRVLPEKQATCLCSGRVEYPSWPNCLSKHPLSKCVHCISLTQFRSITSGPLAVPRLRLLQDSQCDVMLTQRRRSVRYDHYTCDTAERQDFWYGGRHYTSR